MHLSRKTDKLEHIQFSSVQKPQVIVSLRSLKNAQILANFDPHGRPIAPEFRYPHVD